MITQEKKLVSEKKRKQFLVDLYRDYFPLIASQITKRGGSFEEAQDIFQDALIIYYEKSMETKEKIENEEAYLSGIVRHLWFRKHKQNRRLESLTDLDQEISESVDEYLRPSPDKVMKALEIAGKKCMNLLKAFYYHNKSLYQIANDFGFSGTRSATVQKYKCLEKVRDHVKEKEAEYADFLD